MKTRLLLVLLAALVALSAVGCARQRDGITVFDGTFVGAPRVAGDFSGCTGAVGDQPFAVGSLIEISFGRQPECIRSNFFGCQEYEPVAESSLVSTNQEVLRPEGDGWRFAGPGETTLVLTVEGQETLRRTVRAEVPAAFDARVLAQPELEGDYYGGRDALPVDLRQALDAPVLRGGTARLVIRPLAADGHVLCGHPDVALSATDGAQIIPADWDAPTQLSDVFGLVPTGDAEHVTVHFDAGGQGGAFELEVVDPSELTSLVVRELPSGETYDRVFEAMPRSGERDVFGATIGVSTAGTSDCSDASAYFAPTPIGRDSRFIATSYCGDDGEPTIHVFVEEVPSIGIDVVLHPR